MNLKKLLHKKREVEITPLDPESALNVLEVSGFLEKLLARSKALVTAMEHYVRNGTYLIYTSYNGKLYFQTVKPVKSEIKMLNVDTNIIDVNYREVEL